MQNFEKEKKEVIDMFDQIREYVKRIQAITKEEQYEEMWKFVELDAVGAIDGKLLLLNGLIEGMNGAENDRDMQTVLKTYAHVFHL